MRFLKVHIFAQSNTCVLWLQLQCVLYIFTGKKLVWYRCKLQYSIVFLKMQIAVVVCIHDVIALWGV